VEESTKSDNAVHLNRKGLAQSDVRHNMLTYKPYGHILPRWVGLNRFCVNNLECSKIR